ncbi:MAG: tetratricopeptide repeat protein, partial [Geminicoccaceae bacterium]
MTTSAPTIAGRTHRFMTRTVAAIALLGLLAGCATAKPELATPAIPSEGSVALYRDQGWSALEAGRHQDAIKAFGQIARIMPEDADAHRGLGEAHLGQNKLEAALGHFAKAEKIEGPDHRACTLQGKGIGHLRQGGYAEAEAALTAALALDDSLWRAHNG